MRSREGRVVLQGSSHDVDSASKKAKSPGRAESSADVCTVAPGNSKPSNILGITTSAVAPPLRTR